VRLFVIWSLLHFSRWLESRLSSGAIAGITIGSIAGVVAFAAFAALGIFAYRALQSTPTPTPQVDGPGGGQAGAYEQMAEVGPNAGGQAGAGYEAGGPEERGP
jgi:hypothetical protein